MKIFLTSYSGGFGRVNGERNACEFNRENGFFDLLIEVFLDLEKQKFTQAESRKMFFVSDDADEVLRHIENYKPEPVTRKWMTDVYESFEP